MAESDGKSSHTSRGDHQGLAVSLTAVSKIYRSGIGEAVNAVDAVTLTSRLDRASRSRDGLGLENRRCFTWLARWMFPTRVKSRSTAPT